MQNKSNFCNRKRPNCDVGVTPFKTSNKKNGQDPGRYLAQEMSRQKKFQKNHERRSNMTVPNGKIIEIQNEHAPQLCAVKEYSQKNHERKCTKNQIVQNQVHCNQEVVTHP